MVGRYRDDRKVMVRVQTDSYYKNVDIHAAPLGWTRAVCYLHWRHTACTRQNAVGHAMKWHRWQLADSGCTVLLVV